MRYQEFNLTEDELFELNMSPGNLKKMAQGIDARAGMEFELIVPGVEGDQDEYDSEPDYEADEGFPTGRGWTRDIISFFRGGDMGNSTGTIQRAIDSLNEDFYAWVDEDQEEYINSNEGQARIREIAIANVDKDDYDSDEEYDLALQTYIEENESDIRDQVEWRFQRDFDEEKRSLISEALITCITCPLGEIFAGNTLHSLGTTHRLSEMEFNFSKLFPYFKQAIR